MRAALAASLLACPVFVMAAGPGACGAQSGEKPPLVLELYTSEGCSSCPPADRWLSQVKDRPDVIALAFHVDYWDRLGWKDRYASPAWTARQYERQRASGARFVYTPQVLLNGRDYRAWPALPAAPAPSPVALSLARDGEAYVARVTSSSSASADLAGYWAVTEDGHRTQVQTGENAGATLAHDAVVRELVAVARLDGAPLRFVPQAGDATVRRRVQFVVTDAKTGLPVQAVALGC